MSSTIWNSWTTYAVLSAFLTVSGLAGCAPDKDGKVADQFTEAPPAPQKPVPGPDAKKSPHHVLSPAESQLEALIKILDQGHQMHHQVWMKLWGDRQAVGSAFKAVNNILARHRGEWPWKEEARDCPKFFTQLRLEQEQGGALAPLKSAEILAIPCSGNGPGVPVARIEWQAAKLKLKFQRGQLAQDGVGQNLALIGKEANCEITLDADKKMKTLACEGLGQDRSRSPVLFVEFTFFKFDRESEKMIQIRGGKFDQPGQMTEKLDMLVPLSGRIVVTTEEMIRIEDPSTYARELEKTQVTESAPPPAAPAGEAPPDPARADVPPEAPDLMDPRRLGVEPGTEPPAAPAPGPAPVEGGDLEVDPSETVPTPLEGDGTQYERIEKAFDTYHRGRGDEPRAPAPQPARTQKPPTVREQVPRAAGEALAEPQFKQPEAQYDAMGNYLGHY